MNNRLQRTILSIGICFGATVLVISIRGGFDPVSPPTAPQLLGAPQQNANLAAGQSAEFEPPENGQVTPSMAIMYMMAGKTGSFSLPGIVTPHAEPANSATTDDDAPVVGVEVDGHWRAYCLSEMQSPFTHVVNDVFDGVPVSVTFCDRNQCTRVFTQADDSHRPLDIGVGGFRDGQLLLHIDHRNFSQTSAEIPFQDLEFERTTWKEWKTAHPETEICTTLDPTGVGKMRYFTPAIAD